jgi:hypothetical protein
LEPIDSGGIYLGFLLMNLGDKFFEIEIHQIIDKIESFNESLTSSSNFIIFIFHKLIPIFSSLISIPTTSHTNKTIPISHSPALAAHSKSH